VLTTQFRVQFLDASGTIIRELLADAWNAAAGIALVKGMEWPAGAIRIVILEGFDCPAVGEERGGRRGAFRVEVA
jgi:hypothetical protein